MNNVPVANSAPHRAFLDVAVPLAIEAGAIIRAAFSDARAPPTPDNKDNNAIDLVTATDTAVEALVMARLRAAFPTYHFIGEETASAGGNCTLTDDPTVIIDPVDGTTNFVHGFPYVCISMGLVVGRVPTAGVVYNPILNDMYVAHAGYGSYVNGARLPLHRASEPASISSCLFISEGGHDRSPVALAAKLDTWRNLLSTPAAGGANVRGIRCTGSGALNLCTVARGSADAYWEVGLRAWDMAAGVVVVKEAGGWVVGQEYLGATAEVRAEYHARWARGEELPGFDIMGRKALAVRQKVPELVHGLTGRIVDFPCIRDGQ
ncbi:hypothetical protein BC828DRAFT_384436 [Blastocladiella britannica]|nr:hypothetical protein BC828DRAFT_384436 [Blastocladiella britannica]